MVGPYANTERALLAYVQEKLRTGQPFWISADVNSDVLNGGMAGFGFLPALIAAVTAIAPTVANVVGTVAAVKGMSSGGGKSASADQVAAAILPSVKAKLAADGVTLPADAAQSIVGASLLDSFGAQNRPLVIGGLGLLGLLLLMKVMKK